MSIRISDAGVQARTNEPVRLVIEYKNTSTNNNFTVYQAAVVEEDPSCFFSVMSPSGKNISPENRGFADSGAPLPLSPGQVNEYRFNLSKLCTFSEAGTYKIIARKAIYWPAKQHGFMVVSNPLDVKVLP
jgi:hypothetical protein